MDVPLDMVAICDKVKIMPAKKDALWKKCYEATGGAIDKAKAIFLDSIKIGLNKEDKEYVESEKKKLNGGGDGKAQV